MYVITLIDLSAAFDCVSRKIVIPKLRLPWFTKRAAKLIESYLTRRMSLTCVGATLSELLEVDTGIGQGSILGPITFLIVIIYVDKVLTRVRKRAKAEIKMDLELDKQKF